VAYCSANEVRRLLLKLKPNKSRLGLKISPLLFERMCIGTIPSLLHVLNESFSSGLLPNEWKCADITLLHKKGSKSLREIIAQSLLLLLFVKLGKKLFLIGCISFGKKLV